MMKPRRDSGDSRAIRRYFATLAATLRRRAWLLVALMVLGSLTEGISILLLVPLLHLAGLDVGIGPLGRIEQAISSLFHTIRVEPTLLPVLGAFVLVVGGRALLQYGESAVGVRIDQAFVQSLRNRLFHAATHSEWQFYSRRRGSDFMHAIVGELHRVSVLTTQLFRLCAQLLVGTMYLAFALVVAPAVTAVAALAAGGLLLGLRQWTDRARASGTRVSEATNALYSTVHEHLAALKTAKSYGAEERSNRLFAHRSAAVAEAFVTVARHHAAFTALFTVGSALVLSVLVYVAIELLAMPVAAVFLLLFLFARLVPRFSTVQQSYNMLVNALPAFSKVLDLIEQCEAAAEHPPARPAPVPLRTGIRFRGVRFGYDAPDRPAVRDLDLFLPARETTALVGPSGEGKSTVADLLMGLIRPQAGTILIDDTPLDSTNVYGWRARIGYVPQDPFLFHDTIRANLLWARPDATESELRLAIDMAAAADFIASLPAGLDTVIGDRGVLLSGGERQRILLARALLRDPAVLVLDEATSALDAYSEREVRGAIHELRGRMTILLISHRLSAIRDADTIHVLEAGRIVESGTWDWLAGRENGRFRHLCRLQGILDPLVVS